MYFRLSAFTKWYQKQITSQLSLQEEMFHKLMSMARKTYFGQQNQFNQISCYDSYKQYSKVNYYQDYKDYISLILDGKKDVLWPGKPLYFAKSSGSTGYPKLIPITKASFFNQVKAYSLPFLSYAKHSSIRFVNKAFLFLSASQKLEKQGTFKVGRISGIANVNTPMLVRRNKIQIEPDNDKLNPFEHMLKQLKQKPVSVIVGMPAWVNEFMKYTLAKPDTNGNFTAKNLELILFSGTSYKPYESTFRNFIHSDKPVMFREFYAASEGFFAMQDRQDRDDMLLITDQCLYEFMTLEDYHKQAYDKRVLLKDVTLGVDYVILISTQFGFFSYCIGDLVRFTSLSPYRVIVTGRTEAFISIYTEHVMAIDIEKAIMALNEEHCLIREYFVSPNTFEANEPFYEWFIVSEECNQQAIDNDKLAALIDKSLINFHEGYRYYRLQGKLGKPKVTFVSEESFTKHVINKKGNDHQSKLIRLEKERSLGKVLSESSLC